jgi:hypothetical protein
MHVVEFEAPQATPAASRMSSKQVGGHTMTTKTLKLGTAARAVCIAGTLAFAAPALAQDTSGTNAGPGAADAVGAVTALEAAMNLADFGRANEDPTILIGAARAIQMIGQTEAEAESSESGEIDDPAKAVAEAADTDKAEAEAAGDLVGDLLAEATLLARGDETLLAQIAMVEAGDTKGSTQGAGYYNSVQLQAGSYYSITDTFYGGEYAEVGIMGDGDTDVDLFIYDENGNLICQSTSWNDREVCGFRPAWTGPFRIVMENYGSVWNYVQVWSN